MGVTFKMLSRQARLLVRTASQVESSQATGLLATTNQKNGIATEASFDYHPYKLHRLDEGPATSTTLTRDEGLKLYREMVTVRRMETAAANLYKEKAVRGFCHLCSGQEAIYSGIGAGLREQDSVITSYRAHGFTHVMGIPVLGVLAELTGKKSGVVRGKGGSMHMYAKNFYGGNGIVGAQVPIGAGIAFAHKYKEDGGVNFSSVEQKGPLVFEISTYRYHGHSMSDPGTSYRTRDEVQEVRQTRDPITGFRDRLVGAELAEVSELKSIEISVKKAVDADVKKAKADGEIGAEELFYDIYENNLEGTIRGIAPWDQHTHKKTQVAVNL